MAKLKGGEMKKNGYQQLLWGKRERQRVREAGNETIKMQMKGIKHKEWEDLMEDKE